MKARLIAILLLALGSAVALGQVTNFSFTSSPTSWVGGGTTRFITPEDGHTFSMSSSGGTVHFSITDFRVFPNYDWWYLDFSTGDGSLFQPGTYLNATRYPFNGSTPGLSFVGNGRGDNTLTGNFTVLDATYDQNNVVTSFAADFVQYDEGNTSWWNEGHIRYNYTVPEPTALRLVAAAALLLAFKRSLCKSTP